MDNLRPDGRIPRSDYDGHVWYSDGDICACVFGNLALDIEGDNVARLFAAAPDLLAACEAGAHGPHSAQDTLENVATLIQRELGLTELADAIRAKAFAERAAIARARGNNE